jgi:hypothetical protein
MSSQLLSPPTLQAGDVVILDNLAGHISSKAEAIRKQRGAWFLFRHFHRL